MSSTAATSTTGIKKGEKASGFLNFIVWSLMIGGPLLFGIQMITGNFSHPMPGPGSGEMVADQKTYAPPTVRTASNCSGISQDISLGSTKTIINGGAACDLVEWNIDSPVWLIDDQGQEYYFAEAQGFPFKAAFWRAANGVARVTAVFCRPGMQWDGVSSCS